MSVNQPTLSEHLNNQKETLQSYLVLLDNHEKSWGEAEHYSAKRTRRQLKEQLNELDRIISWCKGV